MDPLEEVELDGLEKFTYVRATPAVSQNQEPKPFLDAKRKKNVLQQLAKTGAKIWLLNNDQQKLAKYS